MIHGVECVHDLLDNVKCFLHELASTAQVGLALIHNSQVQVQP